MLNSNENLRSISDRRIILVVDDEMINREILGSYLEQDYEVLKAENGREALDIMRKHSETLSLVILDLLMPVMTGLELLKIAKTDDDLKHIPIIVTTSEQAAELESLQLGAVDFVPKPYPPVNVVLARVLRIIELSEDRDIIRSTERDELTGLLNKEFFYRYAEQYDQRHKDSDMDAIVVDINHFHMVNERYGKGYADEVLRKLGVELQKIAHEAEGIVCRKEADTFLIYRPHRDDWQELLDRASAALSEGDEGAANRIRLRMGVYAKADKQIDIERRFDRAKMASDTVRGSFAKTIGHYDSQLHEKDIYAERLIEDFPAAVEQHQFQVWYQPKFDIRPDTPILAGAEALVRWFHPELGMISPGVFIPLFEENGLIQQLDLYVWKEAARQIRAWKENFEFTVPISVNVSRIDLFDPLLTSTLMGLVAEYGLSTGDLRLEVTESAYTRDSGQIVRVVEQLRDLGFRIEMDDFGSGYSSLNMVSTLPLDTLKLDMQFIRTCFSPGGNPEMLSVILQIAGYLHVPVIAEGVETEEQLDVLKSMDCQYVQGYFFSKPVPAPEFEPFILQRKEADKAESDRKLAQVTEMLSGQLQSEGLRGKPEEETEKSEKTETKMEAEKPASAAARLPEKQKKPGMHLKTATLFFVCISLLAAFVLFLSDLFVTQGYQRMEEASDRYIAAQLAATDMEAGSDYLTDRVRCFVVTGDIEYLKDFFDEVNVTRRRDLAVESLETLLEGHDGAALANLNIALDLSNELVRKEYLAMRMTLEANHQDMSGIPEEIASVEIAPEDLALSDDDLLKKAQTLVFDNNYMHAKDRIRENVSLCTQALIHASSQDLETASTRMAMLVHLQTALTILFLLIVLAIVFFISIQVRLPISHMVVRMQAQEPIEPAGAEELRFVSRTYNTILEENRAARERLSHEASHDALTGLFNRGAYDMLMESVDTSHMALILVDVDYFKSINDTYGHAVGDRVLKRVAEVLQHSFRSVDILCRFGGDEFVVVMTRVTSAMGPLVMNKIRQANQLLQNPKDDLPPVSLSVGVAFSDRKNPQGDIFKDADAALYKVKEAGRNGCEIY